ncbi:MAG: F0F1 ATP synthase subunit alpha, partial [Acidimicrobiia bacterium]
LEDFRTRHVDILDTIKQTGALPEGDKLEVAINDFKARFVTVVGGEIAADQAAIRDENPEDFVGGSA